MTLTGLIGYPTDHSLSPFIHAHWAARYHIDNEYKLFTTAPKRLRQTMLHMRKKEIAGVNITVPHKLAVMEYLDAIDVTATKIGAVNTVINRAGQFIGMNTDVYGFSTNLRETLGELGPYLHHVVLLGAGGAARAAVVALQEAGAKQITVINRTLASAEALAAVFGVAHAPWEARNSLIGQATLLVNTTSLGMVGQPSLEIDIKQLPHGAAVHDIVYAPLETPFLKYARQFGYVTVDGLGMLLYQAQAAFEAWHGIRPEVTADLRASITAHLSDAG